MGNERIVATSRAWISGVSVVAVVASILPRELLGGQASHESYVITVAPTSSRPSIPIGNFHLLNEF